MPSGDRADEDEFYYEVLQVIGGIKDAAIHLENALVARRREELEARKPSSKSLIVLEGGRNA